MSLVGIQGRNLQIQEALKAQADSWAAHCREDKYKPLDELAAKCGAMLKGANE